MDVSFLLPTNRNLEHFAYITMASINAQGSQKYSHEICVASKEEIDTNKFPNAVWYPEPEPTGPSAAFNRMAPKCKGDYIICITDDHIITNPFDLAVDFLKDNYSDKRFKVTSLRPNDGGCSNPVRGQILGDKEIDFAVCQFPLCRFPVMHKSALIELDGYIFNPEFYYQGNDIFLGYFIGFHGEPCVECPTSVTAHNAQKNASWEVDDCNKCRMLIQRLHENSNRRYGRMLDQLID